MPSFKRTLMFCFSGFLLFMINSSALSKEKLPRLETVEYVDLERYLGLWYEVASFPQRFQRGCLASTATYQLRDDGDIDVINRCVDEDSGEMREVTGRAWVTDPLTNAKLRVRFFWPFSGKYWIIELGEDYEYAVVGHPNRRYLWILSRTPEMAEDVYEGILQKLEDRHFYDVAQLQRTFH